MEELLLDAFEGERQAYKAQIDSLKAQLQRQRALWEADTAVSDSTSFLYGAWLHEHQGNNPAIDQMVQEAARVAHESPHMSRVNRIMCMMLHFEQKALEMKLQDATSEVAKLKTLLGERTQQLERLSPIASILEQNTFFQSELMDMGKKVIALEDYVTKAEEIVGSRIEAAVSEYKQECARRKGVAHGVLNTLHFELMGILAKMFDGKVEKVELQDLLVHHLDRVRLILLHSAD